MRKAGLQDITFSENPPLVRGRAPPRQTSSRLSVVSEAPWAMTYERRRSDSWDQTEVKRKLMGSVVVLRESQNQMYGVTRCPHEPVKNEIFRNRGSGGGVARLQSG